MVHYTAKQAADMTGRNERTIRRMIARGELRARKVGGEYAIADVDLPERRRSEVEELRAELAELRVRVQRLERSAGGAVRALAAAAVVAPSSALVGPARGGDAEGRVRLGVYADRHGVPVNTALGQAVRQRVIPVTSVPRPRRPDQQEHWLLHDQQRAAIAYWREAGGFHECEVGGCVCHGALATEGPL